MKKLLLVLCLLYTVAGLHAQKYPEPEFSNEVYYLKKDSINTTTVRLEKSSSKMESKTKMGGFGGYENGYIIEGEKSAVRLKGGSSLSFVFSTGASATSPAAANAQRDSMLRANGADPATMQSFNSMNDPANSISLYKTDKEKKDRKIVLQKTPGALPFGSKKMKSGDKYTFSVRKIREGYWELVIDKNLPAGEYAFTVKNMMDTDVMTGGVTVFAFGVD